MGLAAFIRSNEESIFAEWEAFAQTSGPVAEKLDRKALRDHIHGLLQFIADDLDTAQTEHPDRKILVKTAGDLLGQWDPGRVEQVLSNLIGNAAQHGLETSVIDVAVKGTGEEVILSVHNEGAIPADAIATVFDPLTRGKEKNKIQNRTTSLGLGLFIAREIVTAHGGKLGVLSNEKEGTTFTAHLPRRPPELHAS